MNNFEIIQAVEQIVGSDFIFNIDNFCGNRKKDEYPKIEELHTLFF